MIGSPAGPGGPSQRGLWPLAPAPAPSATSFSAEGLGKYGVYSLLPGTPAFGGALYSHASTIGRFASGHIQQGNTFHTAHKVSDSLFSTTTGYTFGTPTPPPGSPYSPIPVAAQLELFAKGFSNNIIIQQQQPPDFPPSPKKVQISDKRCDEKCCTLSNTRQKSCHCAASPVKKCLEEPSSMVGCSRTNPIEWPGVNVKKEPGSTPCQVAEISTSLSPVVKVEVASPTQKGGGDTVSSVINNNGAQIPVGIAVARQRVQHELVASPSLPPAGLLATLNAGGAQIKEIDNAAAASMAANTSGAAQMGGSLLQCADDRTTGLAAWPMGGNHNQTIATPTLWQYPAPVPVEPMVPLPVPAMPSMGGFQLVRDPTTGGLLLLPTATGMEPLQQTVVWPSYPQPSSVLLPSLSSMPPPPLQLLSSASSDYLSSSTTLHQHTQTHSTRLVAVTTDSKRKLPHMPLPATTLIKIETDGTLDQTKTLQAVSTIANNTGTVFSDPLVTTHVIYQHPTTNLIVSQAPPVATHQEAAGCRSQATSPVAACLTPSPPDSGRLLLQDECESAAASTQDASNQTDSPPLCSEDDGEDKVHQEETPAPLPPPLITKVEEVEEALPQEAEPPMASAELPQEEASEENPQQPDLSGLELLSNSIVEFESCRASTEDKAEEEELSPDTSGVSLEDPSAAETTSPKEVVVATPLKPINVEDNLGGLDLLCALAEQRIREEKRERRREKRKSKRQSSAEPRKKKLKGDKRDKKDKEEQCSCKYKHYKTPESEREVKKFLEGKCSQGFCCQSEWPCMNAMELDMRMKLAELQREYKEKQKELGKLKPKKKSRKKSSDEGAGGDLIKPPKLTLGEDSSSKRRKVSQPKRHLSAGEVLATETIVAKKPKNNFVGYLLAAKEKLKQLKNNREEQTEAHLSPPRYIEETTYTHKLKKVKNTSSSCTSNNNNNTIVKSSNIRPKLKAETQLKAVNEEWDENDDAVLEEVEVLEEEQQRVEAAALAEEPPKPYTLTEAHLDSASDNLRVLTLVDGLFYAGQLKAIEPPDVYSIMLDGERGNRPKIMSREETLKDTIIEASPKSTKELPVGTRMCAYWSQQYRCLYPGTVAEPGTPNGEKDDKFVPVEFDDGDNGRIALQDIRFLPPDYPFVEHDPNPLLSLSKRKRRASTSVSIEERLPTEAPKATTILPIPEVEEPKSPSEIDRHYKEKKRLKKKKRDKLKLLKNEERKKKKKHKCSDSELCKRRKHHKKHKKHHHRRHHDERSLSKRNYTCQIIDERETANNEKDEEEVQGDDVENVDDDLSKSSLEDFPDYNEPANPDDEVTIDDIEMMVPREKSKKFRDRQESCESRSKMSAFLPASQFWQWSGKGYKRPRAKGKSKKCFYRSIQRGKESITVGDAAVFLSSGQPDRPYIGRIESMWEQCGKMLVRVKWYYHPEETVGCPGKLTYLGGLFQSEHQDTNDVQTISHKCDVVPLAEYKKKLGNDPAKYCRIYDKKVMYYLAGNYDPTVETVQMEAEIPFANN